MLKRNSIYHTLVCLANGAWVKVKAVRVNGQITEVKLTKTKEQIRMGDHLASTIFSSLADILGKLGKCASST